jgi:hypothetical protein
MEPGPCASSPSESCQARKGAALRRIPASAADRLGSMVGSQSILRPHSTASNGVSESMLKKVQDQVCGFTGPIGANAGGPKAGEEILQ